jgi:outer membrane protein assembly factor BamE (lipoprotein component of BamABCDE complex)
MQKQLMLGSWRLASLLLLMGLAAGCATQEKRIARYIENNPGRPSTIHSALVQLQPLPGMTPEEVRLCLGSPHETEDESKQHASEIWHYIKRGGDKYLNKGSDIWAMEIPQASVYFSEKALVDDVVFYDEDDQAPAASSPSSTVTQPSKAKQARSIASPSTHPARRERAKLTTYTPKRDELGVTGWPSIELGGILGSGFEHSALLNNDVYAPGETIKKVTLIEVFSNGVLLEYQGARLFLAPGKKTE